MKTIYDRMEGKIVPEPNSGCHIWMGKVTQSGYGAVRTGVKDNYYIVHRALYEKYVGEIPDGFQIHHMCHERLCVNPNHLMVLSAADHTRLHGNFRHLALKTHCKRGHLYDEENTHMYRGHRICKECNKLTSRKRNKRLRARRRLLGSPSEREQVAYRLSRPNK